MPTIYADRVCFAGASFKILLMVDWNEVTIATAFILSDCIVDR